MENFDALPRVSIPPEILFVANPEAASSKLATLDPASLAVVEAPARQIKSVGAQVQILNYQEDYYRVHYSAPGECLLRIAVPFFPGWTAAVDGHATEVLPVDYALSGVIVPAGDHQLTFQYRSRWLRVGAIASLFTAAACLGIILLPFFRKLVR